MATNAGAASNPMEEQLQRQNSLLKSLLDKLQRKIALDRRRLVRIRDERDQAVYRESQIKSRLEDRLHRLTQELADLQGNTDRSYCVIC
ncbi:hypothetical protein CVIRNUC_004627 [Coccomyxa viridis]|uniref:Uncharacterized protein n=1 Tax=Coccomyxa viridis TaxID=1274662 RepID=A0AAV1I5B4_9CHLO|nr:hypothetical protein CVIRNUC_004627 [Coccomyxa viridis]